MTAQLNAYGEKPVHYDQTRPVSVPGCVGVEIVEVGLSSDQRTVVTKLHDRVVKIAELAGEALSEVRPRALEEKHIVFDERQQL